MRFPDWLLWILNLNAVVFVFAIIIIPNFYWGLSVGDYEIILIINFILIILHYLSYRQTRNIRSLFPFLISILFYGLLFFANILG